MNTIIRFDQNTDTRVVKLISRNGLILTIIEYGDKGVIVVTYDLLGNELSQASISAPRPAKEIFVTTD